MPNSIEAQGVTVEEAIQVALNQLGVTRDRVEIEILHHPRGGFLGIGARRAKVRATIREAFLADGEEYDMSSGERIGRGGRRSRRSRRRRGGRGTERREETESAARRPEPKEAARPREPRAAHTGEQRGDRRARGRGRGDERQSGPKSDRRNEPRPRTAPRDAKGEREAQPDATRSERSGQRFERPPVPVRDDKRQSPTHGSESRGERVAESDVSATAERVQMDVPTREEVAKRAEAALAELLRRMGFEASVSSFYDALDGETVIKVDCPAEGLLIGRRGQTLDALEHVINRIVLGGESGADTRLSIDVGGYRERRGDTLRELADRLRARALAQKRRIQVSPMSPRDRRILQAALGGDESIRVRVLGSGFYRRVVIFPSGLDESLAPLEVESEDAAEGAPVDAEDDV
jgi:spoIIIJ-associated protein